MDGAQVVAGARKLRAAERFLRATPETIHATQNDRLQRVVRSALKTEPYRRLYGSDEWVGGVRDLADLPILEREYLASFQLEERQAQHPQPMVRFSTGGTTGRPLRTGWSKEEETGQEVLVVRQRRAQGLPPRDHMIIDFSRQRATTRIFVRGSTVEMSMMKSPSQLADAVRATRPKIVIGDPSLLLEIAEELEHFPVQGVITGGEVLDPQTRGLLEDCFGVRPLDLYASSEGGYIAWECPSGDGYHINVDAVIVEVVDNNGNRVPDGTTGELIVTSLWNHTCPIIRYRTRDMAAMIPHECGCGIRLPLLSQVEGRTNDWIVTPDGRRISPMRVLLFPVMGLEPRLHVAQYRIVQRATDDFLVQVRWKDGRREELVERIGPFYESVLGSPVNVEVEDVQVMPRSPSGKFRVVESLVS